MTRVLRVFRTSIFNFLAKEIEMLDWEVSEGVICFRVFTVIKNFQKAVDDK
jgi:hypothetical protein